MSENKRFKGTWAQRLFIIILGLALGILLFWLLGFITNDIGSLQGPDLSKVQKKYVSNDLLIKQKSLNETLESIREDTKHRHKQQRMLKDGTQSLQNTINQLLSIQKQNIERGRDLSEQQQQILAESQTMFLGNQKQYQALSKEVAELTTEQRDLEKELSDISDKIERQKEDARMEYGQLMRKHRCKIAALKLAVMVPIFLLTAWFFVTKRSGAYGPIVYAAFIAALIRISLIVHEYFPRTYFKYIALLVVIGIVLILLVYLIKRIISPKKNIILKQYQEAYDKCLCPICGKPVRLGPLCFVVGGKRKTLVLAEQGTQTHKQEVYTCPSCGTNLYEKCDRCGDIRHSLLPFCEHCGNEKTSES